ncbi:MAG TPA: hypothetical protein VEH84_06460 [Alphaproteobacteria bacterium]|nr:hypothetical protein [Alphaproteobacteria bacterium]
MPPSETAQLQARIAALTAELTAQRIALLTIAIAAMSELPDPAATAERAAEMAGQIADAHAPPSMEGAGLAEHQARVRQTVAETFAAIAGALRQAEPRQ